MTLSWNEIRTRATTFAKEWENETSEDAEAKSFWDWFFDVFGVPRRRLATFEEPVKKWDQSQWFIDLLWKWIILVEHKSRGRDLDKAFTQAKEYFPGLKDADLPKYILVSDFARFRLYDLETGTHHEFTLEELPKKVDLFGFIAGYQKRVFNPEDPVNLKAALLMGKLHDSLKNIGYTGHSLEVYLVRILFCLFAEDTTIFEKRLFQDYIEQKTNEDGSDLPYHLSALFQTLNTPRELRLKNLDESLDVFPYVNGKLFEENLPIASFDSAMRTSILDCCRLDWSLISPAIFGSLFQSVMDEKARRNLGAHYTSEKNIMKLIWPLFLDDLKAEFESVKQDKKKLEKFHEKLGTLTFLDPACGCGNFLVITYRELRRLETMVIKAIYRNQQVLDVAHLIRVNVDQFYGIEIEEFPSQVATVALWLMDHQMNMEVSQEFGEYFVRLPLKKRATIVNANALQTDWKEIIAPERLSYIIWNPPFLGKSQQNEQQKADMEHIFKWVQWAGVMDFVSAWYIKAAQYIQSTKTRVAFVSTNSITQWEQVWILWSVLFKNYNIKIHFAHRTFKWTNEARGNAAVHVVIIGFASFDTDKKSIFEYIDSQSEPLQIFVKNINPYLLAWKDNFVTKRRAPIMKVPEMIKWSMPNDGGFYLFDKQEKELFIKQEPRAEKYFRRFIGWYEFLNNVERWCLWLLDANPSDLKDLSLVLDRVEKVRELRLLSKREMTRKGADTPTLFWEIRQPNSSFLALPEVSSENRKYIPIGYVSKDFIASNKIYMIPNPNLYLFGVLSSSMHVAWLFNISWRLKSDISYSTWIVYNNFPWPEVNEKDTKKIEELAQAVLDARLEFPESSLADLYDPRTMPPALVRAHTDLDKAVDKLYKSTWFKNDSERVQWLFGMWEKIVNK